MTKKLRMMLVFLAAAVLSASFCVNAYATTRKKINKVSVHIEGTIEIEGKMGEENLDISTSGSNCYYDSYEVQNVGFRWAIDDVPEIKIYITAEDGYYFNITSMDQVTVVGGTLKSASRESNDEGSSGVLVLDVTLTPLANQVGKMSDSLNVNADGLCSWEAAEGAGSYEVKFMRNNATLGGVQTVTGLSFNGGQYMTKAAPYHFMIRPVSKGDTSVKGVWVDSNHITISAEQAKAHAEANAADQSAGTWELNGTAWKFRLPDGTYAASSWREIKGVWYYFNDDQTMATGWVQTNGKWYYLDQASGAMLKNTTTPDGYFVAIDGTWAQ